MEMTLAEAATAVKMTKQGVLTAIKKGRISASKDVNGRWQIDSAELFRVYRPAKTEATNAEDKLTTAGAEVAVLRAKLEAAEAMVDELRRSRDSWQAQAERLALTQKAPERPQEASCDKNRTITHAGGETGRRRPFWRRWWS